MFKLKKEKVRYTRFHRTELIRFIFIPHFDLHEMSCKKIQKKKKIIIGHSRKHAQNRPITHQNNETEIQ